MPVSIQRSHRSFNFDQQSIAVRFVLLHFSVVSLAECLSIFCDQKRKVSAHFIIAQDGALYETVPALQAPAQRAWHAGESRHMCQDITFTDLNSHAIGIELVNPNGNQTPYTPAQYRSLSALVQNLAEVYPALQDPERILGHEHVAGFRGKLDPGLHFDWRHFFGSTYPQQSAPLRQPWLLQPPVQEYLALHGQEPYPSDLSLSSDFRTWLAQHYPEYTPTL